MPGAPLSLPPGSNCCWVEGIHFGAAICVEGEMGANPYDCFLF